MKKTVLLYGLLGGALIALLKLVEYRFLVLEHSLEIYGGIVALLFSALGIWLMMSCVRPFAAATTRSAGSSQAWKARLNVPQWIGRSAFPRSDE